MEHDGRRCIPSAGSVPACFVPPTRCPGGFHALTQVYFVSSKGAPNRRPPDQPLTSYQPSVNFQARDHLSFF